MNIISWLVFGTVTGITANMIDTRPSKGGLIGSIILGILGAVLGGFVASLIFGYSVSGFNLSSFFIAVAGSLTLLFIGRLLRRA